MAEPLAHLYDLALRALDEQQRRADALRGRLGPVLAAAALGASLLSGPLLGGTTPRGVAGAFAVALTFVGLAATVTAAFRMMGERDAIGFEIDPSSLAQALDHAGALDDQRSYYRVMLGLLALVTEQNADMVNRLAREITRMLWGILVMLCGLALAALVG